MPRLADKRLGPMIFWSIAIAVTAIACAALFYAAAGRAVNAGGPESGDPNSHFKVLLNGIDADVASGKLEPAQALAARAELAREVLRARGAQRNAAGELSRVQLLSGLGAIAVISLGLYALLGHPELPARPLADRPEVAAQNIDLEAAVAQIEARLTADPDDVRGWTVIAPAYVQLGRFSDAARAYRRVIELSGPTAELQTDLAEALLLDAGDAGSPEAMSLLARAADADPDHIRSRLYLAAELMRTGVYPEAAQRWEEAIALSGGDEPWLPAARQGLAVAQNGGIDTSADDQREMIAGMVTTLAARLASDGGTVEEWTQLVRSYLVLGDTAAAQDAYDRAVAAYPDAFDRGEMDTIALGGGLTLNGETP